MTDRYPPFRLDQGAREPAGPGSSADVEVVDLAAPVGVVPAASETAAAPARRGAGRIALLVVGIVTALVAFGLLVGGCALVAIDQTQRDDDGFLMSPSQDFRTPTYAIVSESAELDTDGAEWALDTFLGTVRVRSESDREVFVGIGPAPAVTRYLASVEHDVVSDLDFDGDPRYSRVPGRARIAPPGPPGQQTFWEETVSGAGAQVLDWEPRDGLWRVVVMNPDASRGVSADLAIGAELDTVLWIGIGLLVAGGLLAAGAALAITAGARRPDSRA
jgi:hypothetical protein